MSEASSDHGRPYVVCHMNVSVDGSVQSEAWPDGALAQYLQTSAELDAEAWLVGRVTGDELVKFATDEHVRVPEADGSGPHGKQPVIVVVDSAAQVRWRTGYYTGRRVISVVSPQADPERVQQQRAAGVECLVVDGDPRPRMSDVLSSLRAEHGIERLLLQGGSAVNAAAFDEDVIDEISLLVLPFLNADPAARTLFALERSLTSRPLRFLSAESRADDAIWLRYRVEHS